GDDTLLALVVFIDHIVRNAERVRDAACVRNGLRPAALVLRARNAVLRPAFHRHTHDIVTLFLEQPRRDTGIHAATHAHDNTGAARWLRGSVGVLNVGAHRTWK